MAGGDESFEEPRGKGGTKSVNKGWQMWHEMGARRGLGQEPSLSVCPKYTPDLSEDREAGPRREADTRTGGGGKGSVPRLG